MPFVSWIVTLMIAALALLAVSLWHHKRSAHRSFNVIGATGFIETTLEPEGAVIIDGEVWRARAAIGNTMKVRDRIRVIGVQSHLLLVEPVSN